MPKFRKVAGRAQCRWFVRKIRRWTQCVHGRVRACPGRSSNVSSRAARWFRRAAVRRKCAASWPDVGVGNRTSDCAWRKCGGRSTRRCDGWWRRPRRAVTWPEPEIVATTNTWNCWTSSRRRVSWRHNDVTPRGQWQCRSCCCYCRCRCPTCWRQLTR